MIKTIYIKNFILIDNLLLDFSEGFNVLLGETGAGKSIIIKAIDVAMGAKTSKDVLKDPEQHALIEITFEENNKELVVSREISQTGTKCRINGALVTLDEIKQEREKLIDIHTQFQTYTYIQQKYHIELLDSYIESKENSYKSLLEQQEKEYKRFTEASKLLEKIKNENINNNERIEFLKFQIDEIERAEITENEEEELNKELEILSNVQELKELSFTTHWALSGEDNSITEVLGKLGWNLSKIKDYDSDMQEVEENFYNSLENLKDIASTLRSYSETLEDNPERLNEVNERLELIQKLKRKYGNVFETYEKLVQELKEIEGENLTSEELEAEIEGLTSSMNRNSEEINVLRNRYGAELSKIITEELKKLEFECPKFDINITEIPVNHKGKNNVEFMITTNLAKDLAPLVKVASGGEISRIMLAIKTVFASVDKVSTVIFDEIDTGISGKTSISVAQEIFELSKSAQVFAITHQPIIASYAKTSYWISKAQFENKTIVNATKLDSVGKIKALAQISSGVVDEKSINFAKELIAKSNV